MNLYQIDQEYREILDNLYDENGEIDEKQLILLNQNELSLENKAIAYASFIKNLEAEAKAIKAAKIKMNKRQKAFEKKADDLLDRLQFQMEERKIIKFTCPYFDIKLVKNAPSVNDYDPKVIPEKFWITETTKKLDRAKLLIALKDKIEIPGANLKQGMRLQIK